LGRPSASVELDRDGRRRRARRRIRRAGAGLQADQGGWLYPGPLGVLSSLAHYWLITGDTGSGKTRSAVFRLLHEVFQNEPTWGGLVLDDKGQWEKVVAMAQHFGREQDVMVLRVGDDDSVPPVRFNLTGDRSIPFETYARMIVDTAVAMGQNRDQSFFRVQAHTHISKALAALEALHYDVTLENAAKLLLNQKDLADAILDLQAASSETAWALAGHFNDQYLNQPGEQRGGVASTIANYLQPFTNPAVAKTFCRDSTIELSALHQGKILCLSIPQKFAVERRYLGTFLKQLVYFEMLRRYDRPPVKRQGENLLVLWADEAQQFVTASEDGMSDHNVVDRLREAQSAVVLATQSSTSFLPVLGKDKARVLTLNLRNRVIFRAADEEDAVASADFLGKVKRWKRTRTWGKGGSSVSLTEDEVYRIKPHEFRQLPKHRAVVVHCERGFKRRLLPPIEPDGSVSPWFKRWKWGLRIL